MKFLSKKYAVSYIHVHRRFKSSTTHIILKDALPAPAYKPEIVEKNKYEQWISKGIFKADDTSEKPIFSMILPPPNVTGKLHLGHALACTVQDVIVRKKRAMGYNVLWVPGTDHAGIATQGVVEKYLKNTKGVDRRDIGIEAFTEEVWKWTETHGNTIMKQLGTLGCALDWTRENFTMNSKHTSAVNEAFIRLYQKGYIYRKKALVNWCNVLKSTVSDIEVENMKLSGPTHLILKGYDYPITFGLLYSFAYKIFGTNEEIVVSTTMPETMLGDTAIAVHPDDERYKHLMSKRAFHPFTKQTIPIIFDEFVDRSFGSGAVKITPAHSKVDHDVAKEHRLPLVQVITEDGQMQNSGEFDGLNKYECRRIIIDKLAQLDLLKTVTPHEMVLPICSRTGNVIDYLPKEQWFLSTAKINKEAMEMVESGKLKIEPAKFIHNWMSWTNDNRDWCISRQLWWGHRIPAYKFKGDTGETWTAAKDEDTARENAAEYLKTPKDNITVERDTDVLDTWFSSGIYPFAVLGWPDEGSSDFQRFYPLSLMATGHDILGFWVHRMVILGLELTGKLPFHNVLLHGIICDNKGAKMSKSKGNVIDPLDVVKGISIEGLRDKTVEMHNIGILSKEEMDKALDYHKRNYSNSNGIPECGVDALRFTLLSHDVKSHFVNFDIAMCFANKLFCNKIWQSINYANRSFGKLQHCESEIGREDLTDFDLWILSRLAEMVDVVNKATDTYDFHLATKALRTLIYNEFCDVYLEATKPGFDDENLKTGYAHAHTLSAVLNTALRCLNPFMVYLTDELIPKIPELKHNIICNYNDSENYYDFPQYDKFEVWKNELLELKIEKLLQVASLVRELKGLYGISNKVRPTFCIISDNEDLNKYLINNKQIILNFTRCSDMEFNINPVKNYGRGYLDKNSEVALEIVSDDIENTISQAMQRLERKIKKVEDVLTKLECKYSNDRYLNSEPQWSQSQDKQKLEAKKEELKDLQRLKDNFMLSSSTAQAEK